jgi:hypothetical protein
MTRLLTALVVGTSVVASPDLQAELFAAELRAALARLRNAR